MHVRVDKDNCIGCGACVVLCSKTFELGDDGKAYVVDQSGDSEKSIEESRDSCPVGAIEVRD